MKKTFTLAALLLESLALASLPTQAAALDKIPAKELEAMASSGIVFASDPSYRVTIGGFTWLDALYTSNQIGDVEQFTTATIPVKGADGRSTINGEPYILAKKQTHFNAKRSRLFVEAERPFSQSLLKLRIEGDFWGKGDFRLRQAYGEFANIPMKHGVASLFVGQKYSTFMVESSQTETLDNQGPNSNMSSDRQPLVAWVHKPSGYFTYKLSMEQSRFDPSQSEVRVSGLGHDVQVAEYGMTTPMFVGVVIIGTERQNIQFSGAYARFETKVKMDKPIDVLDKTIDGYGINLGGKFSFGENDFVRYYGVYTDGLGLLIPDLETGYSDGIYGLGANKNEIDTLDSFGGYVALEHLWSSSLSSNLVWSYVKVNNSVGQPDEAYQSASYVAANLLWTPTKQLMLGTEYLWGDRRNKDDNVGDASRLMISAQFKF